MANQTITQLPDAGPITGTELVPIVQNGGTFKTTTAAIASSPSQSQTFLTKNQEPTLPNSRYLSTGTGLGLVDGGAQSYYRITLNGASGSLEAASNGIIVKYNGSILSRALATSGAGLSVSDADGTAGNPTFQLTGIAAAVANLGGTGMMAIVGGATVAGRQILGAANQISVVNGNGADDPQIFIANNPIIPGVEGMTIPSGTEAQKPAGSSGQIRFNTESQIFEGYANGSWKPFSLDAGVASVGLAMPGDFVVTNSPVTSVGTLTAAWASQTANKVLASPDGSSGTPTFRALTNTDIPTALSGKTIDNSVIGGTTPAAGTFTSAEADYFQLDTTAGAASAVGRIVWDDGEGSPTVLLKGGNVNLPIGQENVVLVYNGSGSTLNVGQVVAVSGAQGQRPRVVLADADSEPLSAATLGVVSETILNGAEGFISTFGVIRGIDTSAFVAGDDVYLSTTAGQFTATRPPAPAHTVFLGWVIKVNASSGELFLNINNGWELDELHNVKITSVQNNDLLQYTTSGPYWQNVAPSSVSVGTATNVAGGAANRIVYNTAAGTTSFITAPTVANTYLEWSGAAFQWSSNPLGDVSGPASSTDNAIARFDGTTGKLIQNSAVTIADDGTTVISVNSTGNALRITQTGTGNALLVEDEANPDSTPFAVNASGQVGIGVGGTSIPGGVGLYMVSADGTANTDAVVVRSGNNVGATTFEFRKSRGTFGAQTVVNSGDSLGNISFRGYDGAGNIQAAQITAAVDGTPGTNDMPGRLVFSTTADGASTPTERMRIDSAGNVGIGNAVTAGTSLQIFKNITGSTVAWNVYNIGTIQSDVTNQVRMFASNPATAAASFTLGNLTHYYATQQAFGAGSAVTNQFGFIAENTLTGATNNYGFYSNIASGTGRWNFYANGTAWNYFGSRVGVGTTALTDSILRVGTNLSGAVQSYGVLLFTDVASDVTNTAFGFRSALGTQAATFTLPILSHFSAAQGTFRAGSTVTTQYGFNVDSGLVGATNNYGFYSDIPDATGRWNFYANGTAKNIFRGQTSIGGLEGSESLRVTPIASAVNYLQAAGSTTGNSTGPTLSAQGSDAAVPITVQSKTHGALFFTKTRDATTSSAFNFGVAGGLTTDAAGGFWRGLHVTGPLYTISGVNQFPRSSQFYELDSLTDPTVRNYYYGLSNTTNAVDFVLANQTNGAFRFKYNAANSTDTAFRIVPGSTQVNYLQVSGAATTVAPSLSAQGADTNINLSLTSKGTGAIPFSTGGGEQFRIAHTASAVNYVQVTGGATGNETSITATGSDADVNLAFRTKASGVFRFATNNGTNEQFRISPVASSVNYWNAYGAATTGYPTLQVVGTDTNIGFVIAAKGTSPGVFQSNSTQFQNIAGQAQFLVTNTTSAVNYLQASGGITGSGVNLAAGGSDTNINLNLTPKGTGIVSTAAEVRAAGGISGGTF